MASKTSRAIASAARFLEAGLVRGAGITEANGVGTQTFCPCGYFTQARIQVNTLAAEGVQIVNALEGDVVPSQQSLEGFLHSLLGVEECVLNVGWVRASKSRTRRRSWLALTSQALVSSLRKASAGIQ
jgi:hypothetical protein